MDSRDRIKCLMSNTADKYEEWSKMPQEWKTDTIRRVERSCSNKTVEDAEKSGIACQFSNLIYLRRYSTECNRIIAIMEDEQYYLLRALIGGVLNPNDTAYFNLYVICPNANQKERDEIQLRLQSKVVKKICRRYTCWNCTKKETTIESAQTKSPDELPTIIIRCIHCGVKCG